MSVNNRTQLHHLIESLPESLLDEVIRFVQILLFKLQKTPQPTGILVSTDEERGDTSKLTSGRLQDASSDEAAKFFSYAGLWGGRSITQALLRKQAWPDRTP